MNAIMQNEANGKLYVASVPVPKPKMGEVLIKMAASPINPSDLSFLRGTYVGKPNYPVIPGIEGSGVVVASGGGVLANIRLGKRVACSSNEGHGGTWSEYMVTSAMHVVPVKRSIKMEQASMLIVNPMTVLAFINIAKKGNHKAIVNNAAASVLGRMLIKICKKENLPLINIVRRSEQVELLKLEGAENVLNSSEFDFFEKLKDISSSLNATLFFDAVAGNQTDLLIKASPTGSTIMLYSNMSNEPFVTDARTLIQGNKTISSFYLGMWVSNRSVIQTLKATRQVQQLSGEALNSPIQKRFTLNEADNGLNYYINNMTGGKVVLVIDDTLDVYGK